MGSIYQKFYPEFEYLKIHLWSTINEKWMLLWFPLLFIIAIGCFFSKIRVVRRFRSTGPPLLKLIESYIVVVISKYKLTKVFSTKVVSLHRASATEPKNHQNLWGKPLLKKLHDETPKKVRVQTWLFFSYFLILLVFFWYTSFFLPFLILLVKTSIGIIVGPPIPVKRGRHQKFVTSSFNWNRDPTTNPYRCFN